MSMLFCPEQQTNESVCVLPDEVSASPGVQDEQQQAGADAGLNPQQQTAAHASQQVNTASQAYTVTKSLLVRLFQCKRLRDDS
jgi:hypothetical protein